MGCAVAESVPERTWKEVYLHRWHLFGFSPLCRCTSFICNWNLHLWEDQIRGTQFSVAWLKFSFEPTVESSFPFSSWPDKRCLCNLDLCELWHSYSSIWTGRFEEWCPSVCNTFLLRASLKSVICKHCSGSRAQPPPSGQNRQWRCCNNEIVVIVKWL